MKVKFFFLALIFLMLKNIQAQDITYVKQILDTLCSLTMHGRGYVNDGDLKAAEFIKNEFKKDSLLNFYNNYFQTFKKTIATLPGKIDVSLGENKMIPAVDYLVAASSVSAKGNYKVVYLDSQIVSNKKTFNKFLESNYSNKFILLNREGIIDEEILNALDLIEYYNALKAKGIISISKELVWKASDALKPSDNVKVIINKKSITSKIKNITVDIEQETQTAHQLINVIGYIKGNIKPDSFIVFTAHYDHLGQMGKDVFFPGANDNATGTAMILDLAKYYSKHKPDYSIAFIALTGEELGLIGSSYYVKNQLFRLSKIKFLINLDMVGSGDDGIKVVNGSIFEKEFNLLTKINDEKKYLKAIEKRGEAAISDHYPFYKNGVKSFYIYTLGAGDGVYRYHNIKDVKEAVTFIKYNELFKLLTDFVKEL